MIERLQKIFGRGKYKTDSRGVSPESWYTMSGVPLAKGVIPLENRINLKATDTGKPPYAVAGDVRKECSFPENVSYIKRGNYVEIHVKARSSEEAQRVISSNRSCIESNLGTVEIDFSKFKFETNKT